MLGIAITKRELWRGSEEEWANVYHYTTAGDTPLTGINEMIDIIVAAERLVHATVVEFVRARVWSAGGTPVENETRIIRDLAVSGQATHAAAMDREACWLVNFRTARPSATGRPVTLKKFIHSCSLLGGGSDAQLAGTQPLGTIGLDALRAYGESIRSINTPNTAGNLCAPSGSGRQALSTDPYRWIEHHEFRY